MANHGSPEQWRGADEWVMKSRILSPWTVNVALPQEQAPWVAGVGPDGERVGGNE